MPPQKRLNIQELFVVMAIIGTLAAVVIPSIKQGKDRARAARAAPPQQAVEPDGQLNTIEISDYADDVDRGGQEDWTKVVAPLLPLAFMAVVAAVVIVALRRQTSRRRHAGE